ncbi:UDP-N-acetylglucosamine transporter-like [Convolutriloba macropyga]|uniref:UDP-N-acetylglucosamine transporter-like n=1 Tax=Convolutriloba macropyga TaxID=536237 RepID=UPI003F51E438
MSSKSSSGVIGDGGGERNYMKWVSLFALVVQTSSVVLTMRYSKIVTKQEQPSETGSGGEESTSSKEYLSSTAVVMAELLKLVASFLLVLHGSGYNWSVYKRTISQGLGSVHEMKHVAIPAVLYVFQNNFLFLAISNLDAPTYQVSYQLKIFTTAIMSAFILNKHLSLLKWTALLILFTGVSLVQVPKEVFSGQKDFVTGFTQTSNFKGLVFILMACFTSAFAGVYFEKLLKTSRTSVWIRNIQLGFYGFAFGTIGSLYHDYDAIQTAGFYQGYNYLVWSVIGLNAIGGLIVAAVIKYADNILKGFANAVAIISSTICSYYILNDSTNLDIKFALGASMVISATFLYTYNPPASSSTAATTTIVGLTRAVVFKLVSSVGKLFGFGPKHTQFIMRDSDIHLS